MEIDFTQNPKRVDKVGVVSLDTRGNVVAVMVIVITALITKGHCYVGCHGVSMLVTKRDRYLLLWRIAMFTTGTYSCWPFKGNFQVGC